MLQQIGLESEKQRSVFRSLMKRKEIIAYDTSAVLSYSPGISMDEFGHENSDMTLPKIKRALGFSRSRNELCYICGDPGSIAHIDTMISAQNNVPL